MKIAHFFIDRPVFAIGHFDRHDYRRLDRRP